MRILKDLYLTSRFFLLGGCVIAVMLFSYSFPFLFIVGQVMLLLVLAFTIVDIYLLFNRNVKLNCDRKHSNIFSLGSDNPVTINLKNHTPYKLFLSLIDELPEQLQRRDF